MVPADVRATWLPTGSTAIAVIVVFGFGHAFLVKLFAALQNGIVGIKLVALICFLVIAASKISTHTWHWEPVTKVLPPLFAWPTLLTMYTSVMFISLSYAGFNSAIYAASEVSNPDRKIPRALVLGTLLVTVLYLLLNMVFVTATPPAEIMGSPTVASISARAIGGSSLEMLIRVVIGLGTLTSVAGMIMVGPRVISRMADDGVFFAAFRTGPNSIHRAVLLQAGLAAALVLVSNIKDLLGFLGSTLSLSSAIAIVTLLIPARSFSINNAKTWRHPSVLTKLAATFYVLSTLVLISMMLRHDWRDLIRTAATLGSGTIIWLAMQAVGGSTASAGRQDLE